MISEQDAIAIARRVAEDRGWAWIEPAHATLRRQWPGRGGSWQIFSNALGLGTKVRVDVDAETGAVQDQGYIPR